jgi:hypothetical protein
MMVQSKKLGKKNQPIILGQNCWSKSTCPKWHLGQVKHGGKKPIWGVFFNKNPNKKNHDFL